MVERHNFPKIKFLILVALQGDLPYLRLAMTARGKAQSTGRVGLAGARMAEQKHVLFLGHVFAASEILPVSFFSRASNRACSITTWFNSSYCRSRCARCASIFSNRCQDSLMRQVNHEAAKTRSKLSHKEQARFGQDPAQSVGHAVLSAPRGGVGTPAPCPRQAPDFSGNGNHSFGHEDHGVSSTARKN